MITTVYPNPANSTLNIEVKETSNIKGSPPIITTIGAPIASQLGKGLHIFFRRSAF